MICWFCVSNWIWLGSEKAKFTQVPSYLMNFVASCLCVFAMCGSTTYCVLRGRDVATRYRWWILRTRGGFLDGVHMPLLV